MGPGFIVLPDGHYGREGLAKVMPDESQTVFHPSGRPWLIGTWCSEGFVEVSAGSVRVVVIGSCSVTTTRLRDMVAKVRTLSDVDSLVRALPGSFHLLASVNGVLRVQGSLSGLRQVFFAQLANVSIASDQPQLLAALTGAGVDERMVAVRVACGVVPPPLGEQSLWSGVRTLPPGHYLVWESQRARVVQWWRAPEPRASLNEGAAAVRETLRAAVAARSPVDGRFGTDLSGGLDSTSLCFLAAEHVPDLVTFRWGEAEVGNDDAVFAHIAGQRLALAEHVVVPQEKLPSLFADPEHTWACPDEPYLFSRTAARAWFSARLLASHGVHCHVAGHGGDELFGSLPGYLHRLLRRRPWAAIRHARAYRALRRWPWAATASALVRQDDLAAWWRAQANQLVDPFPSRRFPMLGWGLTPLRVPAWVAPQAVEAAREALLVTADHAQPLAVDRGQHQYLLTLRNSAAGYRLLARLFAESGIRLEMPYLDDRVMETALTVRLDERAGPWRYKPLLAEAMRDRLPDAIVDRSTKGEFGEDVRIGLRRNKHALLKVFADSLLAARGLINPGTLRDHVLAPHADNNALIMIEQLLGCEMWLRAASSTTSFGRTDVRPAML